MKSVLAEKNWPSQSRSSGEPKGAPKTSSLCSPPSVIALTSPYSGCVRTLVSIVYLPYPSSLSRLNDPAYLLFNARNDAGQEFLGRLFQLPPALPSVEADLLCSVYKGSIGGQVLYRYTVLGYLLAPLLAQLLGSLRAWRKPPTLAHITG